jgi:RND family efflux transporter MFP subunit
MPRMRSTLIGLILLLLLGACKPAPPPTQGPPPVTVAPPEVRTITEWDEYTGRFVARESVEIRPRVTGYLQRVHFRDGEMVQKGALLFTVDPRPLEAARDAARGQRQQVEARIALARANVERGQALRAAEAISQEEFDSRVEELAAAEAALASARAAERAAEIDLGFTQIRAPIAGRVSDARGDAGNLVNNGETVLTTIVSLNPIHFEFIASEQDYLRYVRLNASGARVSSRTAPNPVLVKLEDEADFLHEGKMDFVDNAVAPTTGTIRGRALLDNTDNLFTPGQFGRIRLLGAGAHEAMLLPDSAIQSDQADKFVLVVDGENTVVYRRVELGPLIDGLRVIRAGLDKGERVVVKGVQRAFPGSKVTPEETSVAALTAAPAQ